MTTRVHVSLPVADLASAVDFYSRLFGQPASKLRPDYANFRLDEPPIHLALVASASSVPESGAGHHGIELSSAAELERWRRRFQGAKDVADELDAHCCYATGDKFWARDPEGRRWEIWVRTGEFDALEQAETMAGEPAGCACKCGEESVAGEFAG